MARLTTRIQVIDRDLTATVPEMAPEAMNEAFRDFARQARDEAREQNKRAIGYLPDYDTRVNGANSTIQRATIRDTIEIEFTLATGMYEWISDMLILNSPVGQPSDPRPGHPELYARSHAFFIDGVGADPAMPLPRHDRAVFVNTQPYARKIERGLSTQVPAGTYHTVAHLASRKFGNFARIRFGFETPFELGAIHDWARTTSMPSPGRRAERRQEWLERQPAIIIDL